MTPERGTPRALGWRRPALVGSGLAAAALAALVLVNSSDELLTAADTLTSLNWAWVAVALLAEVASYWMRGLAQAVVLDRGVASLRASRSGHRASTVLRDVPDHDPPGAVVIGAAQLAGDAAAYCLPLGFAASGVVMVRVLRQRGVDTAVAGWAFAVSSVLYVGAVALLTVAAVEVAGDADPVPGLQQLSLGLLAALAVLAAAWYLSRRGPLASAVHRLRRDRGPSRVPSSARPGSGPGPRALSRARSWWRAQLAQLRVIRLPPGTAVVAFALMMASWLADIAVLGVAFAALDATPPWAGLPLAYCAGQVAAAVPITPGGIGVVEGSLTLALVAFGGAQNVTLAAVLLYRLIAYWGCIPLGGLAWLALRASRPLPAGPSGEEHLSTAPGPPRNPTLETERP